MHLSTRIRLCVQNGHLNVSKDTKVDDCHLCYIVFLHQTNIHWKCRAILFPEL